MRIRSRKLLILKENGTRQLMRRLERMSRRRRRKRIKRRENRKRKL